MQRHRPTRSIEKGLRIAGIGTDRLRVVPHDANFAMRPDGPRRDDRRRPRRRADAVLGRARHMARRARWRSTRRPRSPTSPSARACGCTSTRRCAASPRWCRSSDGSTPASSSPTATAPTRTSGWASTSTATCSGPSDRRSLLGALSILPEYLRSQAAESGAVIDYRDWQVPLGRRFRSLKLWFHLRIDGVEPVQEMIREHVRLTQMLADWVAADERFEIVAPHPLNLLCLAAPRRRRGHRSTHRATPTPPAGAVHPHRARRPLGAALLDRGAGDRGASRARRRGRLLQKLA